MFFATKPNLSTALYAHLRRAREVDVVDAGEFERIHWKVVHKPTHCITRALHLLRHLRACRAPDNGGCFGINRT